jgi:hypothetical protein
MSQRLYNILVSLDQLFNTIAGGCVDVTISGHVGYMATHDKRWKRIENLIDYTFEPIENDHCLHTYLDDDDTDEADNRIATGIIAVIGCAFLIPIIRLMSLFK